MDFLNTFARVTYLAMPWAIILMFIYEEIIKKNRKKSKKDPFWENYYAIRNQAKYKPCSIKNIQTITEIKQFNKLKEWAEKNNALVFPKVHQYQLLQLQEDTPELTDLITRAWAEYVICTLDLEAIAVIFWRANSNPENEAIEDLTTLIFQEAGYNVIFTKCIDEDVLNHLSKIQQSINLKNSSSN